MVTVFSCLLPRHATVLFHRDKKQPGNVFKKIGTKWTLVLFCAAARKKRKQQRNPSRVLEIITALLSSSSYYPSLRGGIISVWRYCTQQPPSIKGVFLFSPSPLFPVSCLGKFSDSCSCPPFYPPPSVAATVCLFCYTVHKVVKNAPRGVATKKKPQNASLQDRISL